MPETFRRGSRHLRASASSKISHSPKFRVFDTSHLEAHLRKLVDLLAPKQSEIERLVADGWRLTWACLLSEDNGQGGITLSPQILRDLGALPGTLWLDIYAGTDDAEG